MTNWKVCVLLTMAMLAPVVAGQQRTTTDVEVQLKAAMQKELVDGDLKAAVELYEKIVAEAGGNRVVTAKALLRLGDCYQKLGEDKAQAIFQRVVREFGDQTEAVAQARTRLASLRRTPASNAGIVTRQVWSGLDVDLYGMPTPDGRYFAFTDWSTGDIVIRNLGNGEKRRLTDNGSAPYSQGYGWSPVSSPDSAQVAYAWLNWVNPPPSQELRVTSLTAASCNGSRMGSRFCSVRATTEDGGCCIAWTSNAARVHRRPTGTVNLRVNEGRWVDL